MRNATRKEYLQAIANYPRKLTRDVVTICEPPMIQYHDLALDTVVAQCLCDYRNDDGSEQDFSSPGKFWTYKIAE